MGGLNTQRLRNVENHGQRRRPQPTLRETRVGPVQIRTLAQRFLAEPALLARGPERGAKRHGNTTLLQWD